MHRKSGSYVCLVLCLRVRLVGLGDVGLGYVDHVGLCLGLCLVVCALVVVLVGLYLVVRLAGRCVLVPGRVWERCTSDERSRSQESNDSGLEEYLDLK